MSNEKLPDGWVRYSWGWRRNYGAGRKAPNSSVVEVEGLFLCEYWPWPTTLPIIPDGDHTTLEDAMSAVDAVYAAELDAAHAEVVQELEEAKQRALDLADMLRGRGVDCLNAEAEREEANVAILRTANLLQTRLGCMLSAGWSEPGDREYLSMLADSARALTGTREGDDPWPEIAQLTDREITKEAARDHATSAD